MSLKRSIKVEKPNNTSVKINVKRGKQLTQKEKLSVTEWLKTTETPSSSSTAAITGRLPTRNDKATLPLNSTAKQSRTNNLVLQGVLLQRTEQAVVARFQKQRQVGIIMTPDEICDYARTIHTELLLAEQEEHVMAIGNLFDASESWFQQFCARYDVPWRPHFIPTNERIKYTKSLNATITAATEKVKQAVTKTPSARKSIAITKKAAVVTKTNSRGCNKKTETLSSNYPPSIERKLEAKQFISDFHEFIAEGGYVPQQVFNAAEMFLHWKLMPQCTKLYKNDRYNRGGDRLSLLFCGNASGNFLVKPMYLHHTWSPQIQDESLLPVYIPKTPTNIPRTCVRAEHFFDWLQHCFIPEVRDFLQAMNLPAKALLLIDPELMQGHSELPISAADNFVELLYFPDKTASLLQPISMTVMPMFACNYLRRLFAAMMANNFVNYNRTVSNIWSQFPLSDSLFIIQQSIEEIKAACWNSGWSTIWKEIVYEPFDPTLITTAIKRIVDAARRILGDVTTKDIEEHLKTNPSLLPAFQAFSAGKNHLNWLDSENESDLDDAMVTDLEKNPFLLKDEITEPDIDEDDELNFETVTVLCDPQHENDFNSEHNSPTPTRQARLPSISDYEIPGTPEFDMSGCKSDLSSPTPSETNMQDIDSDCSTPVLFDETPTELAAFKSEVKNCVVNKIDNLSHALKSIPVKPDGVQAIRSLHEKLDMVVNELNVLKSKCVKIEKKAKHSVPVAQNIFKEPFETASEFRKFDEKLKKHRPLQGQLIRFFSSILNEDTANLAKGIEKIWRSAITDNAAQDFVWKIRRNNERIPVTDFKFTQLLRSLFITKFKAPANDFEAFCGKSFIAAHDRWRKQQRYRQEHNQS